MSFRFNLIIILFFTGFFTFGQLNVLQHLPYVDCLPYAKSKNLLDEMKPPPGSIPDSVAVMYKYKKNGKEVSFDANHFPDDFDETVYTDMKRETVVVRKGNAEPKIQDFALYSMQKEDTTKAILEQPGPYVLFFAKNFDGQQPAWHELFLKLYLKAKEENIPFYLVTNEPLKAQKYFNETNHFAIPVLTCDGTVMKTFLRTKTGVVVMKGATVEGKFAEADMNDAVKWMNVNGRKVD